MLQFVVAMQQSEKSLLLGEWVQEAMYTRKKKGNSSELCVCVCVLLKPKKGNGGWGKINSLEATKRWPSCLSFTQCHTIYMQKEVRKVTENSHLALCVCVYVCAGVLQGYQQVLACLYLCIPVHLRVCVWVCLLPHLPLSHAEWESEEAKLLIRVINDFAEAFQAFRPCGCMQEACTSFSSVKRSYRFCLGGWSDVNF